MAELKDWQKKELLGRIRLVLEDAEWCPEESYTNKEIVFDDNCACYSEWTQDPCSLGITIAGTLPENDKKQWEMRRDLESLVSKWADGALMWSGCDSCGNSLSVDVFLYPKSAEKVRPNGA